MRRDIYILVVLAMGSLFGATFVTSTRASAASGSCYFNTTKGSVTGTRGCSVTGDGAYRTNDVFTGRNSHGEGAAMPLLGDSRVTSKQRFIDYILDRFKNGGTQDKVGAAFVIQGMRNERSWPTANDVEDWEERMGNSRVTFHSLNTNVTTSSWYDPSNHNVFYASHSKTNIPVIEIKYEKPNGTVVTLAQIQRECGNPTQDYEPLPEWEMDHESGVRVSTSNSSTWSDYTSGYSTTANGSQTLKFMHRVRNIGNDNSSRAVRVQTFVVTTGTPTSDNEITDKDPSEWTGTVFSVDSTGTLGPNQRKTYYTDYGGTNAANMTRAVGTTAVGRYICQRVATKWKFSDTRWRFSKPACARVTGYYDLTPAVTKPTNNDTVAQGSSVTYRGRVSNTGNSNSLSNVYWRLTRFTLSPGANLSTAAGNTAPCDGAFTGYSGCSRVQYDNRQFNANTQWDTSSNYTDTGTNLTPGSKICYVMSVKPHKTGEDQWRHSSPSCVTIVAPAWGTNGTSQVSLSQNSGYQTGTVNNVAPQQTVYWRHTLNLTTLPNTAQINYHTVRSGFGAYLNPSWNGTYNSATIATGRPTGVIASITNSPTARTQLNLRQDDVGNTLCQNLVWTSTYAGGNGTSSPACVTVPYSYSLTPRVVPDTSAVEPGQSVQLDRIVNNAGPTKSRTTDWQMVEVIVRKGAGIAQRVTGDNAQNPCAYYGPVLPGRCETIASGTRDSFSYTSGTTSTSLGMIGRAVPNDLNVGDEICWGLSVRPPAHNSSTGVWRHSELVCVKVGKSPKTQFWGADVRSNKEVSTGPYKAINGAMYGSWAEYAIMSSERVTSASAAKLSSSAGGRTGVAIPNDAARNLLTFSNTAPYGNFGSTFVSTIPGTYHADDATGVGMSGPVNIGTIGDGTYKTTEDLTINGGELMSGRTVIIKSTRTVTITGNITKRAGDSYTTNSDVPQLVISANRIIIDASVTQVDAWLIAKAGPTSYVSTCGTPGGTRGLQGDPVITSDTCNQPLIINGPITANHLYLRRTSGSEAGSRHVPAEVLNLRPDTYLWANATARKSQSISTMYTRELPPRF